MKKKYKITGGFICALLILSMLPLAVYVIKPRLDFQKNRERITVQPADQAGRGGDRIHFLNTGSSDAILVESGGKFALIDAGEDTDNPRGLPGLELEGYEDKVLAYLKKHAVDETGKVHLDFVLGTHSHSDHIGGFDTILSDPDVIVERAYLKQYDSSRIRNKEVNQWDNQEVYDQMVHALHEKEVPIHSKPGANPFRLGNFTITLYNTEDPQTDKKVGENDQSFGILLEKNNTRVFLSGDIDNLSGDETRLAPQIGKVHLLKVGHHSYQNSTTARYLKTLAPDTCVVTNKYESLHMATIYRITRMIGAPILVTGKEDGVIAAIGDNGVIEYYNQIHTK